MEKNLRYPTVIRNTDDEGDDELGIFDKEKIARGNPHCQIGPIDILGREINVYISSEISEPFYYVDLLNTLRHANQTDIVRMYINSPGGYVDSAIQIINAMRSCRGHIITILDGEAYSAASLIFLSGEAFEVFPTASMLCHYYSSTDAGKANEVEKSVSFRKDFYKEFFKQCYLGFLSQDELDLMFKGEDFWFNNKQIIKRLNNRSRLINKTKKANKKIDK